MISAGVRIQTRMFRQSRQTTTVRILPMTAAVQTIFATNLRMDFISPAPNRCATGIAKPVQIPVQNPLIMKLIEEVAPTDASAPTPIHLPTTMASTML